MSIMFAHCLRNFRPSKKIRIRFDFLRFRIRCMHFDRKGWGIRKNACEKFGLSVQWPLLFENIFIQSHKLPLYICFRLSQSIQWECCMRDSVHEISSLFNRLCLFAVCISVYYHGLLQPSSHLSCKHKHTHTHTYTKPEHSSTVSFQYDC